MLRKAVQQGTTQGAICKPLVLEMRRSLKETKWSTN